MYLIMPNRNMNCFIMICTFSTLYEELWSNTPKTTVKENNIKINLKKGGGVIMFFVCLLL